MKTKLTQKWKEVRLEEIAKIDSGQGAPQGEKWFTGDKVFVRAGDLNKLSEGVFVGDFCEKINEDAIKKYSLTLYHKNNVVFPKSGMSIATENIAILKYDSYVVNHLAIIETEDLVDSKYIFYLLKKLKILNLVQNSSYPSIRISDIKNLKILWPTKEIRKKIVSILEKAEKLKELRDESDKLTKEYLKAIFLEIFGDPIENKKKWKKSTIGENIIEIKYGTSSPPKYTENGVKFIRATNIKYGRIIENGILRISKEEAKKIEKCKLAENDLIIVRSGVNTGDCAVITKEYSESYGGYDIIFHPDNEILNSTFLNEMLNLDSSRLILKQISRRAGQPHLNSKQVSDFEIILPPINLQNKFTSIVEEIEKMKEYQNQSREQIYNLFNSLMQKAFKGELIC